MFRVEVAGGIALKLMTYCKGFAVSMKNYDFPVLAKLREARSNAA